MQVFNTYFKVIKKNSASIMIYFFIFVAMAVTFLNLYGAGEQTAVFTATKTNIGLLAEETSPLVSGLEELLSQNANLIALEESTEGLQDALFFEKTDYILRIPDGFTDSFMSGRDMVMLEKTTRPMSPGAVRGDMLVEKYLSLSKIYLLNIPDITASEVADHVLRDLSQSVTVEMQGSGKQIKTVGLGESFRYLAYPILSILLMGITTIMMAFNKPEIARRNLCAPLSPPKMSLYLFLGNAVFAFAVWAVLCIISLALYGRMGLNAGTLLLCINALVFTVFCAAVAFLVGKLIKSPVVQAAVTNVMSLGICFLSGVFLDQYFMGETVLKIASFTPGFWYIKAVNGIKELTAFNYDSLKPVYGYMLIQLAFAAACIIIALVAAKQRRQNMAK